MTLKSLGDFFRQASNAIVLGDVILDAVFMLVPRAGHAPIWERHDAWVKSVLTRWTVDTLRVSNMCTKQTVSVGASPDRVSKDRVERELVSKLLEVTGRPPLVGFTSRRNRPFIFPLLETTIMFSCEILRRGRLVAAACLSVISIAAGAQDFPSRPIVLVSPYLAGGSADGIARAIAEVAAKDLGQPVVVEAKPGAEGLIGASDVLKAAPDGYRVLWGGAGSLMIPPAIRKNPPFDPVTDFTPIAASVDFSFFLYVHPSFPAKTTKEFIAYVKANPGKVSYATGNNQGLLTMADFEKKFGLDMVRVKYKGEVGASSDLLTNRVQAMWGTTSVINFAKEGKLRVLSTTLTKRSELLPEVPTLREEGIAAGEFGGGWLGIFGPAGMTKPVVQRLNTAFVKAFNSPEVQTKLRMFGLVYTPYTTPDALTNYVKYQRDLYIKTAIDLDMVEK